MSKYVGSKEDLTVTDDIKSVIYVSLVVVEDVSSRIQRFTDFCITA